MLYDAQGLAVTSERPETVAAIDRLLERQANQRLDGAERAELLAAAEADPAPLLDLIICTSTFGSQPPLSQ